MSLNIGIDFGSSSIYVTHWNENKKQAEAVPNITKTSDAFVDNAIYYELSNNQTLGEKASEKSFLNDPYNCVSNILNYLKQPNWKQYIPSLKKSLSSSEILTDIFKYIKETIENNNGKTPIDNIVISVSHDIYENHATQIMNCAKSAGLHVKEIISSNISAFLHYDIKSRLTTKKEKAVILDFSEHSFNVSVFEIFQKKDVLHMELLCNQSDSFLGGKLIDEILFEEFLSYLKVKRELFTKKMEWMLLKEVKETKKHLSSHNDKHVYQNIESHILEIKSFTQKRLNQLILDHQIIIRIIDLIQSTLDSLNLQSSKIQHVLLIGGSNNIKLIEERICQFFTNKSTFYNELDKSIVVGSGAGIYSGSHIDFQYSSYLDVLPPSVDVFDDTQILNQLTLIESNLQKKLNFITDNDLLSIKSIQDHINQHELNLSKNSQTDFIKTLLTELESISSTQNQNITQEIFVKINDSFHVYSNEIDALKNVLDEISSNTNTTIPNQFQNLIDLLNQKLKTSDDILDAIEKNHGVVVNLQNQAITTINSIYQSIETNNNAVLQDENPMFQDLRQLLNELPLLFKAVENYAHQIEFSLNKILDQDANISFIKNQLENKAFTNDGPYIQNTNVQDNPSLNKIQNKQIVLEEYLEHLIILQERINKKVLFNTTMNILSLLMLILISIFMFMYWNDLIIFIKKITK